MNGNQPVPTSDAMHARLERLRSSGAPARYNGINKASQLGHSPPMRVGKDATTSSSEPTDSAIKTPSSTVVSRGQADISTASPSSNDEKSGLSVPKIDAATLLKEAIELGLNTNAPRKISIAALIKQGIKLGYRPEVGFPVLLEQGETLVLGQAGKEELVTDPATLLIQGRSLIPGQKEREEFTNDPRDLLIQGRSLVLRLKTC